MQFYRMFSGVLLLIAAAAPAAAADSSDKPNSQGAVELNDGSKIPQNPSLPKLDLSNAQREQIRKGVLTLHNEIEFQLKSSKSAKDFAPAVGARLPAGIEGSVAAAGVAADPTTARLQIRENERSSFDRERHDQNYNSRKRSKPGCYRADLLFPFDFC